MQTGLRLARVGTHLATGLLLSAIVPALPARVQARLRGWWSARLLGVLGVALECRGAAVPGALVVANHISWLDVFVINATTPVVFVCKQEVRQWPLIGWMLAVHGTLFLARGQARAAAHTTRSVSAALARGQSVALFPEGTTSEGRSVLPFASALMQAAIDVGAPIQPTSIRYTSPSAAYAGDTSLWQSLVAIARDRTLAARLDRLPPLGATNACRRSLAHEARSRIMHAQGTAAETPADLPAETPSATRPTDTPNPAPPNPAAA